MGQIRRQVDPGTSGVGSGSQEGALLVIFYVITASKGRHKANGQLAERLFNVERPASS